jgi:hypothetical protein
MVTCIKGAGTIATPMPAATSASTLKVLVVRWTLGFSVLHVYFAAHSSAVSKGILQSKRPNF